MGVLISGVPLFKECSGRMSLFQGFPYFKGVLISGRWCPYFREMVSLFQECPYFRCVPLYISISYHRLVQ